MDEFLWVVMPYVCLAAFVVGHFWRYRYDKFGWTTRSSQMYESRLLRSGAPCSTSGCWACSAATCRPVHAEVVDRGGRRQRGACTTSWRSAAGCSPGSADRGRTGDPGLPSPHGRAGVLGDDGGWTR